jgi:hypothetical protein
MHIRGDERQVGEIARLTTTLPLAQVDKLSSILLLERTA